MSPFFPESQISTAQVASQPETSGLVKEEIISLWKERLSFPEGIIQETLKAALDKIEKALEYTDPETKENVLKNGLHFLSVFGLYLSSPSSQTSPPQTVEELIDGLNSFSPDPPFLKPGDTFTIIGSLGNAHKYKIVKTAPLGEIPPDFNFKNEGYVSGTNMWDFPEGNKFIPGNYFLEKN